MPPKKNSKAKAKSAAKAVSKALKSAPKLKAKIADADVDVEENTDEKNVDAENADEKNVNDADDADELPELEYVSSTMKERYEYKPILRAEIVYRNPDDRVTSEVMTRFELCEIVSIRAKQLEKGHKVFTDIGELTNPIDIAKKEVVDKKCPLSIVRMITDKVAEKWQVNEMAIPHDAL